MRPEFVGEFMEMAEKKKEPLDSTTISMGTKIKIDSDQQPVFGKVKIGIHKFEIKTSEAKPNNARSNAMEDKFPYNLESKTKKGPR